MVFRPKSCSKSLLFGLLLVGFISVSSQTQTLAVEIEATMILATDNATAQDNRLEKIEYRLRRVLNFKHYKFIDRKSVNVNVPGDTSMNLGNGFKISVKATKAKGGVRTQVQWTQGGKSLVNTAVVLKKGSPTILGGVPQKGGKLIVVISSK